MQAWSRWYQQMRVGDSVRKLTASHLTLRFLHYEVISRYPLRSRTAYLQASMIPLQRLQVVVVQDIIGRCGIHLEGMTICVRRSKVVGRRYG
jgi:hypothetical protein